jgi:C1A family cysteine protease
MHKCFQYVIDKNGIETEQAYPYNGKDLNQCHASQSNIGAHVVKFEYVEPSENSLLKTLTARGPIATAITVKSSFMGYHRGVYNDPSCTNVGMNHAVLIVGYGNENGQDYWLIKNSWVRI